MGLLDFLRSDVYVIDEHEVVDEVVAGEHAADFFMKCRRCKSKVKQENDWRREFQDMDCHDCDCRYCDA